MDFSLTEEQRLILKTVKEICNKEFSPKAQEVGRSSCFPWENVKRLATYDLMGVPIPEEYGGLGKDFLTWVLIGEELSFSCTTTGAIFGANMLCIYPIYMFGNEQQKRKYLVPLARGECLGAFALTEPDAGSDAAGIRTTATRDGMEYVLNGTKAFITNGGEADIYVVIVKTRLERGARGMSAFIVEKGTPGFTFGKSEDKMAYPGLANRELVFSDCRVSHDNILLQEGRGFRVAMETLDLGRIGMGAGAVGLARRAAEEAVKYSKQRVQFGSPISSFQAIQFYLADMATEIEAARLLVLKAANMRDKGEEFSGIAAMAKLYASEVAMRVVNKATQIHGGYGYIKDYPVERYFREAKLFEIVEGTSEIQRNVIANYVLKTVQ
ncbi:MAG: acyl-CoA dehydrogenase family protein [bacterium]|nr:acyl-CoA dehydrogenase family protein [bacterium]